MSENTRHFHFHFHFHFQIGRWSRGTLRMRGGWTDLEDAAWPSGGREQQRHRPTGGVTTERERSTATSGTPTPEVTWGQGSRTNGTEATFTTANHTR